MSKAQYDIYVTKVMTLARTLVIKSQATVDTINATLIQYGWDVSGDPATWKYYLNLAGEYHPIDIPMSIISLDTLQTIDFTKANLAQHTATYREYSDSTSRFYLDLVSRYPKQEMLIRGILNPVDIQTAINAEDGTILWFDPTLVEDNEENLISGLEAWVKRFRARWDVADYGLVDDLYAASHLGVMYMNIPIVIMNLRLANCHTRFAHSFHIREFLSSHGALDTYVDNLTKKQMLWLYRNIRYLQRNAGKQETFNTLVSHLLTERGLPLAAWSMRHNLANMPNNLLPDVEFVREAINYDTPSQGIDTRTVTELLDAELEVAKGNARVEADATVQINDEMQQSLQDRLNTKVLESTVVDLTDATPYTFSDCLLNHWLYLSQIGLYTAVITVDNPHTGGTYTFSVHEAFIVWLYAINKSYGFTLTTIPEIVAFHVRRIPTPARSELQGIVDATLVSSAVIDAAYQNLPLITPYISTESFYQAAQAIHQKELDHRFLYATQEHFVTRGLVEQMVGRFYCDYPCDLDPGVTYADWFQSRGLDVPTLTELEAGLLATQILSVATGANLNVSQSLKDMQTAMLRLMAQLSSYSVQFLQSINTNAIKVVDGPIIRVGDEHVHMGDDFQVDLPMADTLEVYAHGRGAVALDEAHRAFDIIPEVKMHGSIPFPFELDFNPSGNVTIRERVELASLRILSMTEPVSSVADVTTTSFDDYQAP